jgi:hypothetical protein
MENMRKVYMRIRRLCEQYSCIQGEYNEFRVVYGTQNSVRILGEFLTYSENTRKEHIQRICQESCRVLLICQETHSKISINKFFAWLITFLNFHLRPATNFCGKNL